MSTKKLNFENDTRLVKDITKTLEHNPDDGSLGTGGAGTYAPFANLSDVGGSVTGVTVAGPHELIIDTSTLGSIDFNVVGVNSAADLAVGTDGFGDYYGFSFAPTGNVAEGDGQIYSYGGGTFTDQDTGQTYQVACYTPDVLILTDRGEVRADDLAIGDRVVVLSGEAKPIRWIGRRSYAGRFVNGDRKILPVSIRAGALGEGLPKRDLEVSPLHALYLDGVLVAARDLVNGVSVVQAETAEEVHYLHIELDAHEVIFAEGAPAETFRDGELRGMFQNSAEHARLYPEGKPEMASFAPLVNGGEALQAIRSKIDALAGLQVDAGPLKGFVGSVAGNRIAGWAYNPEQPQLPVRLDICVDGQLVAQALANRYRGDLDEAGIGTGRHGFELTLDRPLPADPRRITVRRAADAKPLPLSHALTRAAQPTAA